MIGILRREAGGMTNILPEPRPACDGDSIRFGAGFPSSSINNDRVVLPEAVRSRYHQPVKRETCEDEV